eukprot:scaffold605_cov400-Prasinococcus_capsulatus_cf.AAC.10
MGALTPRPARRGPPRGERVGVSLHKLPINPRSMGERGSEEKTFMRGRSAGRRAWPPSCARRLTLPLSALIPPSPREIRHVYQDSPLLALPRPGVAAAPARLPAAAGSDPSGGPWGPFSGPGAPKSGPLERFWGPLQASFAPSPSPAAAAGGCGEGVAMTIG